MHGITEETGLAKMTMEEIDDEIAANRRDNRR